MDNSSSSIRSLENSISHRKIDTFAFFPSGSLSSHQDSFSDQEYEFEEFYHKTRIHSKVSDDETHSFVPNEGNIITYEPSSPVPDPQILTNPSNWLDSLAPELKNYCDFKNSDQFGKESCSLPGTLRLRSKTNTFTRTLVERLNFDEYQKTVIVKVDKAIGVDLMQEQMEINQRRIENLEEENGQMSQSLQEYERENEQLRKEVDDVTQELLKLDKIYQLKVKEIEQLKEIQKTYQQDIRNFIELIEGMSAEGVRHSYNNSSIKNLLTYASGKLEIIKSRFGRNRARYENAYTENVRLRNEKSELMLQLDQLQSRSNDQHKQLRSLLQQKEQHIRQLESSLKDLSDQLAGRRSSKSRKASAKSSEARKNRSKPKNSQIRYKEPEQNPYFIQNTAESDEEMYLTRNYSNKESFNNTTSLDSISNEITAKEHVYQLGISFKSSERRSPELIQPVSSKSVMRTVKNSSRQSNSASRPTTTSSYRNTGFAAAPVNSRDPGTPKQVSKPKHLEFTKLNLQMKHLKSNTLKVEAAKEMYYNELKKRYSRSPLNPRSQVIYKISQFPINVSGG